VRFCGKCLVAYQETVGRIFADTGKIPQLTDNGLQDLRERLNRRVRLNGEVITRLAEAYDPPYNSYGRLRAYIEEFDRLPPDRFLKSERKHPVVETIRGME
jgi:hypothetical protein